jgi:hypothetical protein
VQELLGDNWDGVASVMPYIATANLVVTRVNTCATAAGYTLTAEELEMMERWLACDFYTKMDPVYTSKSTLSASGSFMRGKEEPYRMGALALDPSGCLKSILDSKQVSGFWAGKPASEQIPYNERD